MKDEYDFSGGKRGPIVSAEDKTRLTIYVDSELLAALRTRAEEAGTGYQSLIERAIEQYLDRETEKPVTESALRRILHEELVKLE